MDEKFGYLLTKCKRGSDHERPVTVLMSEVEAIKAKKMLEQSDGKDFSHEIIKIRIHDTAMQMAASIEFSKNKEA